ncbi:MAG TPA: hypothetical protein VGJ32_04030, partial [Solirubrobacteraceae bacterium]
MRRTLGAALLAVAFTGLAPGAAFASPYAGAVAASAPSAWWRLGDAPGPLALDAIGGAAGAWSGAVSAGAPGALAGDGDTASGFAGGWLDLGSGFAPSGSFSLEAWVRLTSTGSTRYALSQGGSSTGFHLYVTS